MTNNLNLKNKARNPGSIANDEHNDAAGANRSANGDILAIDRIIPASEAIVAANVPERGTLRIANTTSSWQFLFIGDQDQAPGTLTIANSMAVAPNSSSMLFTGLASSDMKSLIVKVSDAGVQVIIMQS